MNHLRKLAIIGNVLFILWIAYNAIDSGFARPRPVEAMALGSLVLLLIANIILLSKPPHSH